MSKLNLGILEQHAREVQCALPGTASLKARLHHNERFIPVTPPANPADGVCHFCGGASPSPDCAVQLPMCGDVENQQGLLGQSTIVRTAMIVVPRCRGCREAHLDFSGRRTQWHEQRAETSQVTAAGLGRKPMLAAGLVGALTWAGTAYGVRSAIAEAGATMPNAVGLLAGVGATAATIIGLKRASAAKAQAAMQAFVAQTPEPSLPSGIKPEEAYLDFGVVRELRRVKWSFGRVYAPEQATPREVAGLVSAAA